MISTDDFEKLALIANQSDYITSTSLPGWNLSPFAEQVGQRIINPGAPADTKVESAAQSILQYIGS